MKRINLPLLFFTATALSAGDLKMVSQPTEIIQPESPKKELPTNQLQMSINIDNESASTIANGISEIPEKIKKAIKDTVDESIKSVTSEMRASIADIVRETMSSMPKPEVVVIAAPTPVPTPEKVPRLITNDVRLARQLAEKHNKKLIVFFGNLYCPKCKNIGNALERNYVIKTGDEYIAVIMDWLEDKKQLSDLDEIYRKEKPSFFRPGYYDPPIVIIESPKHEILSMKRYSMQPPEGIIIKEISKDVDYYRYR
jgi:protein-disulfide isomerase